MDKRKKITAFIIAAAIIFTMLFSALFVVGEAEHNCSGAECVICCLIRLCVNNFSAVTKSACLFCIFAVLLLYLCLAISKKRKAESDSPVNLKVKLLN